MAFEYSEHICKVVCPNLSNCCSLKSLVARLIALKQRRTSPAANGFGIFLAFILNTY